MTLAIADQISMKRMANPGEVAHVVAFQAGDELDYITGPNPPAKGGLYPG